MSRNAVALIAALGIVLLVGCGVRSAGNDDPGVKPEKVANTARIVCDRGGSRVLTPVVRARGEGVRFVIGNRTGVDTYAAISFSDGSGEGADAPEGKSKHLADAPPGKMRIGCETMPEDDIGKIEYASLKVVDPEDVYKSIELECPSGVGVTGISDYVPGASGEKGSVVELARESFAGRLKPEDVVERAGYAGDSNRRYARVVRDGRVVATAGFTRANGGWLQDEDSSCSGF